MNEPPTSLGLVPHQVSDLEMNLWSCSNPLMEGKVGSPPLSTNTTPTAEVSEGHSLRHGECSVQGTLPRGNEPMALPDLDVELLTRLHHAGQKERMNFGSDRRGSVSTLLCVAFPGPVSKLLGALFFCLQITLS